LDATHAVAGAGPAAGDIGYLAALITADSAQLADWHGTATDEALTLDGVCPACGHDSPNFVLRKIAVLEARAVAAAGPVRLTVRLDCTCIEHHDGQPDTRTAGCGRSWLAVTLTEAGIVRVGPAGGAPNGPLPPVPGGPVPGGPAPGEPGTDGPSPDGPASNKAGAVPDPAEVAAATQAIEALGKTQLADISGAAEKWIGGVTALFGLFSIAGVTLTRGTVTALGTQWQVLVAVAGMASLLLAGWSVYLMYQAAYGWPTTVDVSDDTEKVLWYRRQAQLPFRRAERMRAGVRAAAGALAAVAVTALLLWFAPQQQAAAPLTQATLTGGSVVCGTLLPGTPGTTVIRRASDGTAVSIPLRSVAALTPVSSC
jgi:hypothetical protein